MKAITTQCCIAGGGPAGMVLGYLLARAGVDVVVLEKHPDFLRDFRGDTIHPSTLQVMHELGFLDEFLRQPHEKASQLTFVIGDNEIPVADFSHLKTRCNYIAFMPQWDFLDFFAQKGLKLPNFHLYRQAQVVELLREGQHICGVVAATPKGSLEVRSALVVGADGRHSTVRALAGLKVHDLGAPLDVLWMRLSHKAGDPHKPLGIVGRGKIFIMLFRGDYWQCGFVIPKGGIAETQKQGLEAFRKSIAQTAPFMADRVGDIQSWDDVKLLTVAVDRLEQWSKEGLLCIGDAAHAMSPVGGVGINIAIQDAVAAANILAPALKENRLTLADLQRVQRRREVAAKMTQELQTFIQKRVIRRVLGGTAEPKPHWAFKVIEKVPALRRIPAWAIGVGFRPEHVDRGLLS